MRRAVMIATGALMLAGIGCVQQDKYDNTVLSARSLKEQLVVTERARDTARANLDDVRGQLSEAKATNVQLQDQVVAVNADFEDQVAKYDELLRILPREHFRCPDKLSTEARDQACRLASMLLDKIDIARATRYTPTSIAAAREITIPRFTRSGARSPACVTRMGPIRSSVSAPRRKS